MPPLWVPVSADRPAPGPLLLLRCNGPLVPESLQASATATAAAPSTPAARLVTFCFIKLPPHVRLLTTSDTCAAGPPSRARHSVT